MASAYASVLKAPASMAPRVEHPWSIWISPFGGYNATDGNAAAGTHDVNTRTYGAAAGLTYHIRPNAVLGFALAGGGNTWGLEQGLGSGRSDAFLAGLYGKTYFGPAYLKAALAFANHWASTDRYAFAGDHLTAEFNAYSFGGRIEGGYRLGVVGLAITPYAALQAQSFHMPNYSEFDVNGGGFGLAYAGHDATDTRSELGARFDNWMMVSENATLHFRVGLGWAHDWVTGPSLSATFEALPGASFIVDGASQPAELRACIS